MNKLSKRIVTYLQIITTVILLYIINGCGSSNSTTSTANDLVVTVSPSNNIQAVIDTTTYAIVVFNSTNQNLSNLSINLTNLPDGWTSSPESTTFTCNDISPVDNGCQLVLKFKPKTLADTGKLTLTINYLTENNAPTSSTYTINYKATAANNLTWTIIPTPPVNAVAGFSQLISTTFNADISDVSQVYINLGNLSDGFKSLSGDQILCPSVADTGNTCEIFLNFRLSSIGSGVLNLPITYINNQNLSKSTTVPISYNVSSLNKITVSGPAKVDAPINGTRTVIYTLNTNGGNASGLTIDLSQLANYSGWSSPMGNSYTCPTVLSSGNGCEIALTFSPTSITESGFIALPFTYTNNANKSASGKININYLTTVDNHTIYFAPTQTISPIYGNKYVNFGFISDGGIIESLTMDLSNISNQYPGWSSEIGPEFTCPLVTLNSLGCVLQLKFHPESLSDSGILKLAYNYRNNAGITITSYLTLPYQTTPDNQVYTNPTYIKTASTANFIQNIAVNFVTDKDEVTNFNIPNQTLPAGWSIVSNNCPNTMSNCYIVMRFDTNQLQAFTDGSFQLKYTYTNDAGLNQIANLPVQYSVTPNSIINYSPIVTEPLFSPLGESATRTYTLNAVNGNTTGLTYKLNTSSTDLIIESGQSTCTNPINLNNMQSCTIAVKFTPSIESEQGQANISYTYLNNTGASQSNAIYLEYATPSILQASANPTSIATISGSSSKLELTLTAVNGNVTDMQFLYTLPTDWSLINTNCKDSLAAQQSCKYNFSYNPTTAGQSGTFSFPYTYKNDDDQAKSNSISVNFLSPQWILTNGAFAINGDITALSIGYSGFVSSFYVGTNLPQTTQLNTIYQFTPFYNNLWAPFIEPTYNGPVQCLAGSNYIITSMPASIFGPITFIFNQASPSWSIQVGPSQPATSCGLNNGTFYYSLEYVWAANANGLFIFQTTNLFPSSIPGSPSSANGMAFDNNGNIYLIVPNGGFYMCTNTSCSPIGAVQQSSSASSIVSDRKNNIYVGWLNGFVDQYTNGQLIKSIPTPTGLFPIAMSWDEVHQHLMVAMSNGNVNINPIIYAYNPNTNNWINTGFPFTPNQGGNQQFLKSDNLGNTVFATSSSGSGLVYLLQY